MTGLNGMKEICGYVQRSEPTVIDWIYTEDFPATKIKGVWMSDRDLIDAWRKEYILNHRRPHKRAVKRNNRK